MLSLPPVKLALSSVNRDLAVDKGKYTLPVAPLSEPIAAVMALAEPFGLAPMDGVPATPTTR